MTNSKLIPFGKYKGQPLEALSKDRDYCDWLSGQGWFRERYAEIHTIIINNFSPPEETPEHNALQALFLDLAWAQKLLALIDGEDRATRFPCERVSFEDGADVTIHRTAAAINKVRVECKPSLGDDYPSVLRQMRASRADVLLIGYGGYVGTGATLDQVKAIFKMSGYGIKVIEIGQIK